jgi:hypothetical protein
MWLSTSGFLHKIFFFFDQTIEKILDKCNVFFCSANLLSAFVNFLEKNSTNLWYHTIGGKKKKALLGIMD